MERNVLVKLKEGSLGRVEGGAQVIHKSSSDPFLVTRDELSFYGDRLEVVSSTGREVKEVDEPFPAPKTSSSSSSSSLSPASHWKTAQNQAKALDTVEDLRAFIEAEKAGKSRDSVVKAAEERLREVRG